MMWCDTLRCGILFASTKNIEIVKLWNNKWKKKEQKYERIYYLEKNVHMGIRCFLVDQADLRPCAPGRNVNPVQSGTYEIKTNFWSKLLRHLVLIAILVGVWKINGCTLIEIWIVFCQRTFTKLSRNYFTFYQNFIGVLLFLWTIHNLYWFRMSTCCCSFNSATITYRAHFIISETFFLLMKTWRIGSLEILFSSEVNGSCSII